MLLEAETAGFGASGRNGGFVVASLTHGIEQRARALRRPRCRCSSASRWRTSTASAPTSTRYGIDCDFEATGELLALTDAYQEPWIEEEYETLTRFGHEVTVLDGAAMRAEVNSPTYIGGVWDHTGAGILDPASSPRACATRRSAPACASTSTPRCTTSATRC